MGEKNEMVPMISIPIDEYMVMSDVVFAAKDVAGELVALGYDCLDELNAMKKAVGAAKEIISYYCQESDCDCDWCRATLPLRDLLTEVEAPF